MFISGTNDEKDLKISKKECLQNCLQKEFIWKCSEKRFKIYAKFLKININFQNTGKTLAKFNKNRVRKNDLLEIIYKFIFNKIGYLYKCGQNPRKMAKLQVFNSNIKWPSSQIFFKNLDLAIEKLFFKTPLGSACFWKKGHYRIVQPPTTSYNFAANTHDYPQSGIISPPPPPIILSPPPTTSHNFTPAIHDLPQPAIFHRHHPHPPTTNHN